jgi:dienelactone hydrolase
MRMAKPHCSSQYSGVSPRHLIGGVVAMCLCTACLQPLKLAPDDSHRVLTELLIPAPNPGEPGPYGVRTLFYGSGTDKQRPEYRDSVTLTTQTVDGSKLAEAPSGSLGRSRERYWGFDFDSLPVNGRVWYPDGEGPFPLVLIVHGNHNMKDFSDPGYAYLGELLASRGYILASVDENFLNGNIRGENDARGWMLLQHVQAWKSFNDSTGSPFEGKVDMENIALIGHSRGGEAVAIAGAFNRLNHYPDDATIEFDFNFNIKALIAIAPIDGQYEPTGGPTPLANVNYLVVHGSHDGDVSAFSGLRQYQRIEFTDGQRWFKSAIWMYRANHGQWNTVWGNQDWGARSARYLDLRALIEPEEQREFAKIYFSAFLDATLKGKTEYLLMFADHRAAGRWLPKTMYATRFQDNGFKALADYSEDVDVTTGSVPGVTIEADSLGTWREAVIPLRWRNAEMGHNAVWLGWNNRIAGDDTTKMGQPGSYTITVSDSLRAAWEVNDVTVLQFSLAPTDDTPEPREAAEDSLEAQSDSVNAQTETQAQPQEQVQAHAQAQAQPQAPAQAHGEGAPALQEATLEAEDSTVVDLSVEVVDADGMTARLPLSRYGAVRKPLEITVRRRKGRDESNFRNLYEMILQTYIIPLADFAEAGENFDPAKLRSIRFVFDRTPAGTVILSDVGLSNMDPTFLVASGPNEN